MVGGEYAQRVFYGEDLLGEQAGDKKKMNYRIGFNYEQKLAEKIWFKTGARFAKIGFVDSHLSDLRWGSENVSGTWVKDPSLPHEIKDIVEYSFIEVPAIIRFEFTDKRWQPFFEVGIGNNFYLKSKFIQKTDIRKDFSESREPDVNKYQLSGILSIGVNYAFCEDFKLFLQPVYRHHITQVNDMSSEIHLINYGVEVGARLRLY